MDRDLHGNPIPRGKNSVEALPVYDVVPAAAYGIKGVRRTYHLSERKGKIARAYYARKRKGAKKPRDSRSLIEAGHDEDRRRAAMRGRRRLDDSHRRRHAPALLEPLIARSSGGAIDGGAIAVLQADLSLQGTLAQELAATVDALSLIHI